jgi:hypothetical protein
MPRIIVTTDFIPRQWDRAVLLDEHVDTVHLSTDHGAAQLVERIAWAISDAEDAEDGESGSARLRVTPSALARARHVRLGAARRPAAALVGRPV